jgi:hypothetical protein
VAGVPGHDPTLPNVEVVVDGKTYHLVYDFNAVVAAEKATGVNLLASVLGEISAASLRGLLWAALLKEHPKVTLEQAGAMIRPSHIPMLRNAIVTAWFGSTSDKEESEGEAQEIQSD